MSIKVSTNRYEILIRYNSDGKIGICTQNATIITDSGVEIGGYLGEAVSLSLADLKGIVSELSEDDLWVQGDKNQ